MNSRIQGRWLGLTRSAWVLLAILITLLIAASIPFEYAYYKSICMSAACATDLDAQLTLGGVQALQAAAGLKVPEAPLSAYNAAAPINAK